MEEEAPPPPVTDAPSPPQLQEDEVFTPTSNFSIPIHSLLHTAQQSHGIVPHNDYAQYRTYLTNRLSRIRHHKAVFRNLTHGPKSKRERDETTTTTATSSYKKGGKHSFQPRDEITVEKACNHIHFILDGIYMAERSWAHSMELKGVYEEYISSNNTTATTTLTKKKKQRPPGKVRQHYINQLKKAVKHVEQLETIVIPGVCDHDTCMEMACYGAWMKGNYYCEVKKWKVSTQKER